MQQTKMLSNTTYFRTVGDNLRLDTENDNLARQLVNSKIEMRKEIDTAEDDKDTFEKELQNTRLLLREANDEKRRLQEETQSLKAVLKREVTFDSTFVK